MSLKVLTVGYHACARLMKEYAALTITRTDISNYILCKVVTDEDILYRLGTVMFYRDRMDMLMKVQAIADHFDIIHYHNEPNWPFLAIREVLPDIPMVLDCHDMDTIRTGKYSEEEDRTMQAADGFIFPSIEYKRRAKELFPEALSKKPSNVVYSMCNKQDVDRLQKLQFNRIPGIVYEGGSVAITDDFDTDGRYEYRNYIPLAKELTRMGMPFHMYGVKSFYSHEYYNTGAIVLPPMPYTHLLNNLTRYNWGWCGPPSEHPQWHAAMPNKLFEYIAAGIPVMVYKADECAKFVSDHGLGLELLDLKDMQEAYPLHSAYREKVQEVRSQFVMETQVDIIVELYERVIKEKQGQA